jgi:asparagine synthase (glutamine-hydrolysing)
MCGIAGIVSLVKAPVDGIERKLAVMSRLVAHRGPDGQGEWQSPRNDAGLAHRRLSIIDLSEAAAQPMHDQERGTVLVFNGEIYNFRELREEMKDYPFRNASDSECILAVYARDGLDCLSALRGMFAFAIWDEKKRRLFCARDRFGVKPLYYAQVGDEFYFASEAKALLPFLPEIATDEAALAEYFVFQYGIGEETLFKGIKQLLPGHALSVENGKLKVWRYWDINYTVDFEHSSAYFQRRLRELTFDAVKVTLRSDVEVGAYLSGGFDSSLVSMIAAQRGGCRNAFHGKFTALPGYDESRYARMVADASHIRLHDIDISASQFRDNIEKVIYHLDFPVAGPGSFPQYMVSQLAAKHVKVVLGGQGGDEIFGGYARYLLAYFEQCIKAAIDGTYKSGNYVVTIESIIPNLGHLREYTPLMREFWKEGLFGPLDERYFRLIDRTVDIKDEVNWHGLDKERVVQSFKSIFNNRGNVKKTAYFDSMSHYDLKCLLPALLHVEDRMSMAHGLESRVPLLDHHLVEFVATVPADIKMKGGNLKHFMRTAFGGMLPKPLVQRRDKMGFPVPLQEWLSGDLSDMVHDVFGSAAAQGRSYVNTKAILANFGKTGRFSRKLWGLLSLELWQRRFHDRAPEFRNMLKEGS